MHPEDTSQRLSEPAFSSLGTGAPATGQQEPPNVENRVAVIQVEQWRLEVYRDPQTGRCYVYRGETDRKRRECCGGHAMALELQAAAVKILREHRVLA